MQLVCPDCGSRFRVASDALGEAGRKVRCTRCSYEWFAEPADLIHDPMDADDAEQIHEDLQAVAETAELAEEEPPISPAAEMALDRTPTASAAPDAAAEVLEAAPALEPMPDFSVLDRKTPPKSSGVLWIANAAMALIALLTALFVFRDGIVGKMPAMNAFYQPFGFADSRGFKLADIALTEMTSGKEVRYGLSGTLINTTKRELPLPILSFRLVDKQGEKLRAWSFEQPGTLKAGGEIGFNQSALEAEASPDNHAFIIQVGSSGELMLRR